MRKQNKVTVRVPAPKYRAFMRWNESDNLHVCPRKNIESLFGRLLMPPFLFLLLVVLVASSTLCNVQEDRGFLNLILVSQIIQTETTTLLLLLVLAIVFKVVRAVTN